MTRGILFDFDGTLIDTWHLYLESFRRTLEPHFNRLLSDAEILALRPIAERRLLGQVVEGSQLPDYFSSFLVHYRSIHDVFSEGLYPGVVQMLTEARRAGYLLGIVTGKSRAAWETTFEKSALHPFDVVVTDDEVAHPKPNPEGLLTALALLDLRPSDAFYIGDSLPDCRAARLAGVAFGAALWPKQAAEQGPFIAAAKRAGAKEVFSDPASVARRFCQSPSAVHCDCG